MSDEKNDAELTLKGSRERLANKRHFAMCQTCDMDEPIHDDTGREAFGFHGIVWNDPIRSD